MNIGVISYASAATLFFLFFALLLTRWRGRLQGGLMTTAVVINGLWALSAVYSASGQSPLLLIVLENLRNLAWIVFMLALLKPARYAPLLNWAIPLFIAINLLIELFPITLAVGQVTFNTSTMAVLGHIIQAIIGLSLIEQLFRYTESEDQRWSLKHLYLGIGCLFVYDFFLYADTLLFRQTDPALWQVRGFINAIAIPLFAISVARNPSSAVPFSVSHTAVFNLTAVFGASLYLLMMAGVGYYIRAYQGAWGTIFQVAFLFLAALLLLLLMFSHQFRSGLSVQLSKHFFRYKYDYRNEWLKLLDALASEGDNAQLRSAAVPAMAHIVTSGSGMLWWAKQSGEYRCEEHWNMPRIDRPEPQDGSLPAFLKEKNYVVNLHEFDIETAQYTGLELPTWLQTMDDRHTPWLVVPLLQKDELSGFIVLGKPVARREINWEDRDFLIAAGRHIAGYLALLETSEALSEARQFEAFNRLSAYVVHDLKNVVAQLELISSNAERHKDNPKFMEDVLATVANAAGKMNRMLGHLRQERVAAEQKKMLDVVPLIGKIVMQQGALAPVPVLESGIDQLNIYADGDRFEAMFRNLVQNAQEATESTGQIKIRIRATEHRSIIEIADNGCGMDAEFVRNRLFKPFDTTKGNAGMGIGVYEVREFIRALGGGIDVSSEPGIGTTFTIDLPLHKSAQQAAIAAE